MYIPLLPSLSLRSVSCHSVQCLQHHYIPICVNHFKLMSPKCSWLTGEIILFPKHTWAIKELASFMFCHNILHSARALLKKMPSETQEEANHQCRVNCETFVPHKPANVSCKVSWWIISLFLCRDASACVHVCVCVSVWKTGSYVPDPFDASEDEPLLEAAVVVA